MDIKVKNAIYFSLLVMTAQIAIYSLVYGFLAKSLVAFIVFGISLLLSRVFLKKFDSGIEKFVEGLFEKHL